MQKRKETEQITEVVTGQSVEPKTGSKISKIQQYINDNRKQVMYVSAAVIVVVVLIFVIKGFIDNNTQENNRKSALALSRILPYYQSSEYQLALLGDSTARIRNEEVIGLIKIVDEYESTEPGKIAALYAGNAYLNTNKPTEAQKYFDIANKSSNSLIQAGATAGIAALKEQSKNYQEAAAMYEKAIELTDSDIIKLRYKYYTALCYEKSGNKEKAGQLYNEIIVESEMSEFASYSKSGLARIGIKIE